MGPHSPLSPLSKYFSSQWLLQECSLNDIPRLNTDESSWRQTAVVVDSSPNDSGHAGFQVVPGHDVNSLSSPGNNSQPQKEEIRPSACELGENNNLSPGEKYLTENANRSCVFDNQDLKTPCFSDSPSSPTQMSIDSPLCLSKCISPMMLLSPLRKPWNTELSVYLPENYTPAAIEVLESSLERSMFLFPSARKSPSFEMNDFENETRRGDCETSVEIPMCELMADAAVTASSFPTETLRSEREAPSHMETELDNSLCKTELEFSRLYFEDSETSTLTVGFTGEDHKMPINMGYYESSDEEIDVVKLKEEAKEGIACVHQNKSKNLEKIPVGKSTGTEKEKENIALLRNKLERDRRKELNSKLDKLRQIVPEVTRNKKASKIVILNKAVEYVNELNEEEAILVAKKTVEKLRNAELLRKLVQINSKKG